MSNNRLIMHMCMHTCTHVCTHTHTHTTYIYTDFLIRVKYHIAKNEPVLYGSHK